MKFIGAMEVRMPLEHLYSSFGLLLFVLSYITCQFDDVSTGIPSREEIKFILDRHNTMRRQEGAANMNLLVRQPWPFSCVWPSSLLLCRRGTRTWRRCRCCGDWSACGNTVKLTIQALRMMYSVRTCTSPPLVSTRSTEACRYVHVLGKCCFFKY